MTEFSHEARACRSQLSALPDYNLVTTSLQPAVRTLGRGRALAMHGLRKDSPARVVVADDHDVTRAGLCAILSSDRHLEVVGEASNGSEALELCRRLHPHLVVTDVRMPDMDGLALTRAVKRESPTTSVILFTMYENPDYLVEAVRAGAAGYMLKGAHRDEILTNIRQVVAGDSVLQASAVLQLLRRMSSGEALEQGKRTALTQREQDVLRLIALGQTNRQIADTLTLTLSTVKTHVEHVIGKLGVSDRTQAAVRAIELGLAGGIEEPFAT